MPRRTLPRFLVVLGLCAGVALGGPALAQGKRTGQDAQKKYDELVRSAEQSERIGYVAAGVGVLLVVAAIPLGIYLGRKKKAR
ncbi:hypothetical protein J0H58_27360 [bacterium]|nr:hypothetical protein [bacterium]